MPAIWQALGQVYYPVSENIDIGLKYRYFHAGSSDNINTFTFSAPTVCNALPPAVCTGGVATFNATVERFVMLVYPWCAHFLCAAGFDES